MIPGTSVRPVDRDGDPRDRPQPMNLQPWIAPRKEDAIHEVAILDALQR
jgi:hypothetical protein